jgi:hypothetical protein
MAPIKFQQSFVISQFASSKHLVQEINRIPGEDDFIISRNMLPIQYVSTINIGVLDCQ